MSDTSSSSQEQPKFEPITPSAFNPWFDFLLDKLFIFLIIFSIYIWQTKISSKVEDMQDLVFKNKKSNEEIMEVLYSIRSVSKADRAILGQFHNGSYWASGLPWLQLTATHEAVGRGIEKVSGSVKGVPIERLGEEVASLLEKPLIYINIEEAPYGCAQHLRSIGCSQVIEGLVCSIKQKPLGIVSIQYARDRATFKLSQEERERIKELVNLLGYTLSDNKSGKKKGFIKNLLNSFNSRT